MKRGKKGKNMANVINIKEDDRKRDRVSCKRDKAIGSWEKGDKENGVKDLILHHFSPAMSAR